MSPHQSHVKRRISGIARTSRIQCAVLLLGMSLMGCASESPHETESRTSFDELPGASVVVDARSYSSIQAAIDAVPDSGGIVKLPPGEFEITEPIRIRTEHLRLEGSGAATNIVNRNADGQPAILVAHDDMREVANADRLWRVSIADLRITGNADSGIGIHAILVEEIFIHGVTVTACGGDGIFLDFCYEDPRVSDCLLTYNSGFGLRLEGCHDIVVSANQFEENTDALLCSDGFNLCMSGNNLDDHLDRGVVIENTYGSVVSGNMIEECVGTAIVLDRNCFGTTLSANVIAHNGKGIELLDAHGCAVSANTFTIMKSHALYIGPGSGRITVTGNNFSDSYVGDDQLMRREDDREAGGLMLDSTDDICITGNVFSGLRPKATAWQGDRGTNVVFESNVVVDAVSEF